MHPDAENQAHRRGVRWPLRSVWVALILIPALTIWPGCLEWLVADTIGFAFAIIVLPLAGVIAALCIQLVFLWRRVRIRIEKRDIIHLVGGIVLAAGLAYLKLPLRAAFFFVRPLFESALAQPRPPSLIEGQRIGIWDIANVFEDPSGGVMLYTWYNLDGACLTSYGFAHDPSFAYYGSLERTEATFTSLGGGWYCAVLREH